LDKVKQGEHTKWSIVYDIKNMKVYFKTFESVRIKSIDLISLDFSCTSPVQMIDINSSLEGSVNTHLTNYSYDANRKLIEDAYNGVDFLKDVSDEDKNKTASYPEKLNCRSKSGNDLNSRKTNGESCQILFKLITISNSWIRFDNFNLLKFFYQL